MAAVIKNLYIEQGADYSFDITLYDDAGLPYDMTIYELVGVVKIGLVVLPFTFVESLAGVTTLSLTAAQTSTMETGLGEYSVQLKDNVLAVRRLLQGRVHVDEEIR